MRETKKDNAGNKQTKNEMLMALELRAINTLEALTPEISSSSASRGAQGVPLFGRAGGSSPPPTSQVLRELVRDGWKGGDESALGWGRGCEGPMTVVERISTFPCLKLLTFLISIIDFLNEAASAPPINDRGEGREFSMTVDKLRRTFTMITSLSFSSNETSQDPHLQYTNLSLFWGKEHEAPMTVVERVSSHIHLLIQQIFLNEAASTPSITDGGEGHGRSMTACGSILDSFIYSKRGFSGPPRMVIQLLTTIFGERGMRRR